MSESTRAPQAPAEEDWDVDSILDEVGITDEPGTEEGPPEQEDEPLPDEGAPAQDPAAAPADAQPDVESAPEEGSAAAPAAPGSEASTAPDQTNPETQPRPFTFNVDGENVAPEGAFVVPQDGEEMLVIPMKTFMNQLRPNYLGSRTAFRRQLRAKDLEIEDLKGARTGKEAEVQVILDKLEGLLSDRAALTEFLTDFEVNAPVLREQAKSAGLAVENENLRRGKMTPEDRIREEEKEVELRYHGLAYFVEELAKDEFPDLPADSLKTVYQALTEPEIFELAFRIADEDDPQAGLKKGKPAVYLPLVRQYLRHEAAAVERLKTTTGRVAETVRENSTRVSGGGRKPIPPAGRADGSPAPTPPAPAEPKNRKEWLDSLERDD